MREINATCMHLNMQTIQSALQDTDPGQLIILRGAAAQRCAYMMLCDYMGSDFTRGLMPVAFSLDKGMRPDQLAVYTFDAGITKQVAIIRTLAVPIGFDPPEDSLLRNSDGSYDPSR